ncbi:MAG: tRNA epoxyqueuosine(34) reductase QueG [Bacteroidales bacterium]|jgi:epoxyqueuosine reductase|nr:tRNA epoxyqueuosine(34) reductase QueG [Bacteroidales bacterium]
MMESKIKEKALSLGFSTCGIASATHLILEQSIFENIVNQYYNDDMHYLARDTDRRFDPKRYFPNCQSVIVCLFHYPVSNSAGDYYKIARYALLQDYHVFIKAKLEELADYIRTLSPTSANKTSVDTAPVTEKNWAVKAGLGTIGKNTLFRSEQGSFCLIGTVLTTLPLHPDPERKTECGYCDHCVKACPTGALTPYRLDWRKCLSYLTVSSKGELPDYPDPQPWIYGCDICQEVCPHNNDNSKKKQTLPVQIPLYPRLKKEEWENLTPEQFKTCFKGSSIGNRKFEKIAKQVEKSRESLEGLISKEMNGEQKKE